MVLLYAYMELDKLKAEIHAGKCVPHMDFPEFGRRVHKELDEGKNVVAIEAFIDKEHFNWFLVASGVSWRSAPSREPPTATGTEITSSLNSMPYISLSSNSSDNPGF